MADDCPCGSSTGRLSTKAPRTPSSPLGLHGAEPASSQGTSCNCAFWDPPSRAGKDTTMDSGATPDAASTTVNRRIAGLSASAPGRGESVDDKRNGSADTRISPASVTVPGPISTAWASLKKLGVSILTDVHGTMAAEGSSSQVAVTPCGAGTSSPGNPPIDRLPAPAGSRFKTTRRWPISGSSEIMRGSTPTQQEPSASLS